MSCFSCLYDGTISLMTEQIGIITAVLLGLVAGSFAGASVWRLRARQLLHDKHNGEEYDKAELRRLEPLLHTKTTNDRSQCLRCHHTLSWYDLLPLFSWLSTGGKCRYCKKPIGRFEPLIEIGTAVLFAVFFLHWTYMYPGGAWVGLGVWVVMLTMFVVLFAYDAKWFLLPDSVMLPLIGLASAYAAYAISVAETPITLFGSTVAAVAILAGLYLTLWLISKGNWVGFGDVKLGLALGLLLMDWKLALLTLFLANLIGTVIVLPGILTGKMSRKTQIPFGPLLILGFFIALFWGQPVFDWYNSASAWLASMLFML